MEPVELDVGSGGLSRIASLQRRLGLGLLLLRLDPSRQLPLEILLVALRCLDFRTHPAVTPLLRLLRQPVVVDEGRAGLAG